MWQKIIQNRDPKDVYADALQSYEYNLGEVSPKEPEFDLAVGGLIITVKVPVLLVSWETVFQDKEDPLFQIFKYLPGYVDITEVYHEELIKDAVAGVNQIVNNIYLSPGRYYFKLSNCKVASCLTSSFMPENSFIMLNDCHDKSDIPTWNQYPTSSLWIAFYALKFRIKKADLYLGFEPNKLPDYMLFEGAFYHSIDPGGYVRTYIYHDKQQLMEGQKI